MKTNIFLKRKFDFKGHAMKGLRDFPDLLILLQP